MELIILLLFSAILLGCILLDIQILYALCAGFVLFFTYGLIRKYPARALWKMAYDGAKTVKNILLTFLLIGMLTASWRASGTIAVIISYSAGLLKPSVIVLMLFWLNCIVSFLTGTSFGTSATMGVICMTMARAMQINPALAAGSILAGAFFGDRSSPVSTSALLVSEVTKTDIYGNLRRMFASAALPFAAASLLYLLLGIFAQKSEGNLDITGLFASAFVLHFSALLPALLILGLSLCRVNVKKTMAASIAAAVAICVLVQKLPIMDILRFLILGYQSKVPEVARMLDGGGVISMVKVSCIVCLSSSFSGIFKGTHMLDGIKAHIEAMGAHMPRFLCVLIVSTVSCAVSCNQTLAIILTNQLCDGLIENPEDRALALEDAPVVIAPLIPWSIAGAVPIAVLNAPKLCIPFAFYLFFVPIWHLLFEAIRSRRGCAVR